MSAARPATLAEVARLAGVSLTTASKAVNGMDRISTATRERVRRAAATLDYVPNERARSLMTGRTRTVGLIMTDSRTARFAVPVMVGAEDAMTKVDLSLVMADARGDDERVAALAAMLQRRRVDGILVIGDDNRLTPTISDRVDVPVVYVYGRSTDDTDQVCLSDNEAGGRLVAEHLLSLGRRRIAHLTGPRRATSVATRATGVRGALGAARLRVVGGVRYGRWSQRWGREATLALLDEHPDVDAIVCGSDQIAFGAALALTERGRRMPEDVALTGYDDWEPFAVETEPPLTSVAPALEELGRTAARQLHAAIADPAADRSSQRLTPRLVVRGSTVTGR